MSGFLAKLEYKYLRPGAEHVKADQWFASSRLCVLSAAENSSVLRLSDREWRCGNCGVLNGRDASASVNLEKWGG